MTFEEIELQAADGTTLRGRFYPPATSSPAPAVLMTHGFSAVIEMGLIGFAERFCAAGFAVLVYDHRNLGGSGGEPRQEINPWAQMRDQRDGLTWLASRPEVDADRLAVWGSSYSGGQAIVLGAVDDRVQAVVANVPFAGLGTDYGSPDETVETVAAIARELEHANGHGLADDGGDVIGPLAVVRDEAATDPALGPPFLDQSESAEWFLSAGAEPPATWRNRVTLRNAFATEPAFDPGIAAMHLAGTPLLVVVADGDRVAPVDLARATFERAAEPKQLFEIEGDHFTPYAGSAQEQVAAVTVDFLRSHLTP